jgi:trimeric autotransporter adhesin
LSNKIGTNSTGSSALPNAWEGLAITDSATGNTVGDPTNASNRNIISGNNGSGVKITSGANNNGLDGNYIGLGADGNTVIPNALAGVAFFDVSNNALSSGSGNPVKQYIAGNLREGVYALNSSRVIINNATYIGVKVNGTPAGNGLEGVKLDSGTTNAMIRPGKVMNNGGAGIAVVGSSSVGNEFLPVEVGSNTGLPIDLGNDGATNNGTQSPPGPNNWMNYPTITSASGRNVTGSTCPGCYVYIYSTIGNPRAGLGGGILLTHVSASGTGAFGYTLPVSVSAITMVAYDTINCSEMSPKYEVVIHTIFMPLVIRH